MIVDLATKWSQSWLGGSQIWNGGKILVDLHG